MFLSKKRSEMGVFCFEEVANSGYTKKLIKTPVEDKKSLNFKTRLTLLILALMLK